MKFFIILLIIAIVCKATDPVYADFTKGGAICHAVNKSASQQDFKVLLGMVDEDDDLACTSIKYPDNYIQMDFVGLNYYKQNDLSQNTQVELTLDGSLEVEVQEPSDKPEDPEFTLSYAAVGSSLDDNGIGGYLSYTSILLMNGEELKFNKNKFKYMNTYVTDVCIGKVDLNEDDGCSVEKRTANTGYYKFSLYGQTGGDSYQAFAADYTHMGFRQQMDLRQMGDYTIRFNNSTALDLSSMKNTLGTSEKTAITSMQISVADSILTMDYKFENDLIFGKVTEEVDDSVKQYKTEPKGMAVVEIFVKQTEIDNNIYTIDYVFEKTDATLQEGGSYFVYDPTVHALPALADEDEEDEDSSMILSAFIVVICLVLL